MWFAAATNNILHFPQRPTTSNKMTFNLLNCAGCESTLELEECDGVKIYYLLPCSETVPMNSEVLAFPLPETRDKCSRCSGGTLY